jgi:hypothetical protein
MSSVASVEQSTPLAMLAEPDRPLLALDVSLTNPVKSSFPLPTAMTSTKVSRPIVDFRVKTHSSKDVKSSLKDFKTCNIQSSSVLSHDV